MTRSYKKPYIKIPRGGKGKSFYKRLANKIVRYSEDIDLIKNCRYKRLFDSWEINDYVCYYPEEPRAYRK